MDDIPNFKQLVKETADRWREAGLPDPCEVSTFAASKLTPGYSSHWYWLRNRNGDLPLYGETSHRVAALEDFARCLFRRRHLGQQIQSGQLVWPAGPGRHPAKG